MIVFCCPQCAKQYEVREEFAGRKTMCRKCGQPLIIPQQSVSQVADSTTKSISAANARSDDASENYATLVLFRKRSATAGIYQVTAWLDGHVIGHLNEDVALTVKVSPGQHTLEVSGGSLHRSQELVVDSAQFLKFETHFSNWGILGGGILLQPMNETAKQAARESDTQKASHDMVGVILQGLLFTLVMMVGVIGSFVIGSEHGEKAGILWTLLWLAAPLAFYYYRKLTECPKCRRAWAKTYMDRTLIDRTGAYQTVTRYDEHKNVHGELIGKTERQEQVHVVNETYLEFYHCKYCGHEWTETSSHQYEG